MVVIAISVEEMIVRCVLVALVCSSLPIEKLAVVALGNVDVEEPSVIRSPAGRESGDGFGWAAIFHRIEPVSDNDTPQLFLNRSRIIIGAPRGTFPGGLPLDDDLLHAANRAGLVYSCTLEGLNPCEGVRGDTSLYLGPDVASNFTNHFIPVLNPSSTFADFFSPPLSEGRLFDQAPSTVGIPLFFNVTRQFDRKEGQLMGSFLTSIGDRVMACASRWGTSGLRGFPQVEARGICFVGNRSLQSFRTIYSCRDNSANSLTSINNDGFCSSGFSGALLDDQVIVGAPGGLGFSGHVFSRQYDLPNLAEFNTQDIASPFSPAIYFGFQVATGRVRFDAQSSMPEDIAVSAPRYDGVSGYLGRVFVYPSNTPLPARAFTSDVIQGRQTSEFFGYSITLVDLTGDGYDELVVGAPMYTRVTPLMPELGRIYIFFNTRGSFDVDNPLLLDGNTRYGRFGFTVANAGDLSADGYEDVVVSAPYESSSSNTQNTGAVYVYYGAATRSMLESQPPQKIHADTIVDSLTDKTPLRTFGFSLAGGFDVDGNRHDDILTGTPDSQTVVVLRSLPFVDVRVVLSAGTSVDVDTNPSFNLTIDATYQSRDPGIQGPLCIRFTVQESLDNEDDERRLFFSNDNIMFNGQFEFNAANSSIQTVVTVFAKQIVSQLDDYQLMVELQDIPRVLPEVDGRQMVTNLTAYPRLRLLGNSTINVDVIDPCFPSGCTSDVILQSITPSNVMLVAGVQRAVELNISFANMATEEARSLELVITNIPTQFFTSVVISSDNITSACDPPAFDRTTSFASTNCTITSRFRSAESGTRMLTFGLTSDFIGNEDSFYIDMEITLDETQGNRDNNTANNEGRVRFMVGSQSGISLSLFQFSNTMPYSVMPVQNILNSGDLGERVSLAAVVSNSGPSIIQEARLMISLPSRVTDITGSNYFLYPFLLAHQITDAQSGNNIVTCSQMELDPDQLNTNNGRRRRSISVVNIAVRNANREAMLKAAKAGVRRKRQASPDFELDCSSSPDLCTTFTCDIRRLTTEGVRIVLDSNLDGRFFGTRASNRTFELIATANVSVLGFQDDDDMNTMDNIREASVILVPNFMAEEEGGLLIHAIIWPIIGGVIIFVALVILLYCVGFFRRKKKPGDDEIEGDFDAPPQGASGEAEKSTKLTQAEEATMM